MREYRNGEIELPWYCNSSSTDYVYYTPSFTYLNNTCATNLAIGDTTLEDSTATEFVTYFQDTATGDDADYSRPSENFFVLGKLPFLCRPLKSPLSMCISVLMCRHRKVFLGIFTLILYTIRANRFQRGNFSRIH